MLVQVSNRRAAVKSGVNTNISNAYIDAGATLDLADQTTFIADLTGAVTQPGTYRVVRATTVINDANFTGPTALLPEGYEFYSWQWRTVSGKQELAISVRAVA